MIKAQLKAKPESDVIFTQLDNSEAVLLHLGTQAYYSLNATGVLIWQLLDKGLDLGQIGSEIANKFDVSPAEARQSVSDLATELAAEKLVTLQSV